MTTCPKCGFEQPEAAECRRCGVIFARVPKRAPEAVRTAAPPPRRGTFFRSVRISILLLLLIGLIIDLWLTRVRVADWDRSLWVIIYPICGDDSPDTRQYVDSLTPETFAPVAGFFADEAARYGMPIEAPFTMALAPRLDRLPPQRPDPPSPLSMIFWSLQLRLWAWRSRAPAPAQDIQMFVIYHDGRRTLVEHSYGLQKGYIGVVNAYAARKLTERNNIVIAHELLHLAGATDKYDPASERPVYPDGYAEPDAEPLHPQLFAEIMAGAIPLTGETAAMPDSLDDTVVGPATAREINWLPNK